MKSMAGIKKTRYFRCFLFFTGLQIASAWQVNSTKDTKKEAIFPLVALKKAVLNDFNIKVLSKDES